MSMEVTNEKEMALGMSRDVFFGYIWLTEELWEIKDIEKRYDLFSEKLKELIEKISDVYIDQLYDMTINLLKALNEFNETYGLGTRDEYFFKQEIQKAYPRRGLLGLFLTDKVQFGKELVIELYKGMDKQEFIEISKGAIINESNLNKTNTNHDSDKIKNNCEEESIKSRILKMSSEMPYKTIVIKNLKKGTTVGIDTRLNKICFEKCKKTGKMLLVIKKVANENTRRIEVYLDNIIKVSDYESKRVIEVYEKDNFTKNNNIVCTENNTKPSINNRYNLHKPDVSNNINTNVVKNNTELSIDNKHNRLTKEDEQEIKKDLSNLYSCKIIIIKDRKKDTTINLDKRFIEVNYVRGDRTGKMILTITSSSGVNKRKIEVYFENIIKLTKNNFRFTIDASEVMVYKL